MLRTTHRVVALVLLAGAAPLIATAAVSTVAEFGAKLTDIQNWMFTFLLAIAVIFIIGAAFVFLSSAGDPKKVEQAKNTIIYAVVAIIVAFLARAIVGIVVKILG
jgi:hypothetical protein